MPSKIRSRPKGATRGAAKLCLLAVLLWSCASQSRLAPVVTLPVASDLPGSFVVAFPPPPAQVEVLPAPPAELSCVWVDGQWTYKNQDFEWAPGAWFKRPSGCAFAKSRLWWEKADSGAARLHYRPGRWVIPAPPYVECPQPAPCTSIGY